ncbi:MCE family protein [Labedaea rhizosphaerae]|uniref:MCE family protein n=1 Tax=Labedaea rhizosphaerae TaxID=598644 RepID=UPI0024419475|nr:MCE family protein [Labedaea rhizosphaerae]
MRFLATTTACATLLAGCGFGGAYDLPLPGGADLGDHPYRVTVQFADVLDLVPQAAVKVNDVPVGRVEAIDLSDDGFTALVTVAVNGDVHLPADASAELRQSSLLGEKYVELSAPAQGGQGVLADHATIPVARTNRNTEVEEVFGALSLLLNGGGIGQIQNISRELDGALSGNEPQIRSLLANLNALTTNLDAHKVEITHALDGLNKLAGNLSGKKDQVAGVLDHLSPGLQVLNQQRGQLVTMLQSLQKLSTVAVDTMNRSREDLLADLQALAPTLQKLAEAGEDLPQSLQILLTFPFSDAAMPAIKGDYVNAFLNLDAKITPPAVADPKAPKLPLPAADTGGGR